MIESLQQVLTAAGPLWLAAAMAVLLAAACEAAKAAGDAPERGALGVLAGLSALAAPFLLLMHAFWAVAPRGVGETEGAPAFVSVISLIPRETLAALGIVAAVLLFAPSLLGGVLGRARALGGALYRASPWLNAGALAFTVFVTYRGVAALIDLAMSGPT